MPSPKRAEEQRPTVGENATEAVLRRWDDIESSYLNKLKEDKAQFDSEALRIRDVIGSLQETIHTRTAERDELDASLRRRQILLDLTKRSGLNFTLVNVFFPLLVLNLLVYLRWTANPPLPFLPMAIVGTVILVLFALPAFAAVSPEGQDALGKKLETVDRLLVAPPAEKGLFLLGRLDEEGRFPKIQVRDEILVPLEYVRRNRATYYFTQAALFWELGQKDSAFRALQQVSKTLADTSDDFVLDRTIRFLVQEHADDANALSKTLIPRISDVQTLAALAAYLAKRGYGVLRSQTSGRILDVTVTAGVLREPIKTLLISGDNETAAELFERAIRRIQYTSEAQELAEFAIENHFDLPLGKLAQRAAEISSSPNTLLPLATLFFQSNRDDVGRQTLLAASERVRRFSDMKQLVDFAISRSEFRAAVQALERALAGNGPQIAAIQLDDPSIIYDQQQLPLGKAVSFAVLLGVLNEKLGIDEGAAPAYSHGAELQLEEVLGVGAFDVPVGLRSLFYIQRFWRKHQEYKKLASLLGLYGLAQSDSLKAAKEEQTQQLDALQQTRQSLEAQARGLQGQVDQSRTHLTEVTVALAVWSLRIIAGFVAISLVLYGCGRYAWQCARNTEKFAAYVCYWRFSEALGVVCLLSVVGLVPGLIQVVAAQLFLILKSIEENRNGAIPTPVA